MAVRSEAQNVFDLLNTGVMVSNSIRGMCIGVVSVLSCIGTGLVTD
jgi:hypothetical protein